MASYIYPEVPEHRHGGGPCKTCRMDKNVDFPVPKPLTEEESRALALRCSGSVIEKSAELAAILERFEGLIHKRWMRKTGKQRLELLLKARPTMPPTHRPDFEPFRNMKRTRQHRSLTCNAEAQLWPSINQEDLLKGNLLLLFLHSRGRNLPEKFLVADMLEAHTGSGWPEFDDDNDLVMLFINQRTPKDYGRLVNKQEADKELVEPRLGRVKGLLALEIQEGIYSFLLECTKVALHDIAASDFNLAPIQPTPQVPDSSPEQYQSGRAHTLEAPYRVPQQIDLDHVRHIVGSRARAAADHVFSLREDPGYLLEQLKEWKEHNPTRHGPKCTNHTHGWGQLAGEVTADGVVALVYWSRLVSLLAPMAPMHEQFARANKITMRFQEDDEYRWTMVLQMITTSIARPISHLNGGLPRSPRIRSCYSAPHSKEDCRSTGKCPGGCENAWNLKNEDKTPRAELRVDRIFYLVTIGNNSKLHGMRHLTGEIQYMLDTDTDANALLDSWLLEQFSDLAVLVDLQHRIEGMRPWSDHYTMRDLTQAKEAKDYFEDLTQSQVTLSKLLEDAGPALMEPGESIDSQFDYPSDKSRSKETVNTMRKAEQNLDVFWKTVQLHMVLNDHCLEELIDNLTGRDFNKVFSTPAWTEDEEQAAQAFKASKLASPGLVMASKKQLPYRPASNNRKREILTTEKLKPKTRGTPNPDPPPATPALAPAPLPTPTIRLPARVYGTISSFLPTTANATQVAKEVGWEDFLYALNALGLVPEKLYGSVWIFKPVPPGEGLVTVHRSIQFHEPKEVRRGNKMAAFAVKKFGRRLKRAFGWEEEMFGLA